MNVINYIVDNYRIFIQHCSMFLTLDHQGFFLVVANVQRRYGGPFHTNQVSYTYPVYTDSYFLMADSPILSIYLLYYQFLLIPHNDHFCMPITKKTDSDIDCMRENAFLCYQKSIMNRDFKIRVKYSLKIKDIKRKYPNYVIMQI